MTTLAEKLRAWEGSEENFSAARAALVGTPADAWDDDMRFCYLRGHDDAKAESAANVEMSRNQIDALTARVRELEATLLDEHSRLAQEEAQPAAVGVVGAVKYAATRMRDGVLSTRAQFTRHMADVDAEKCKSVNGENYRVVAIVDPDAIVPLASAEPVYYADKHDVIHLSKPGVTVTPLYPGIAQPAQERDG